MLGLGYSVGTPEQGITANAIVVNSFAELKKRAKEVDSLFRKKKRGSPFNAYCILTRDSDSR